MQYDIYVVRNQSILYILSTSRFHFTVKKGYSFRIYSNDKSLYTCMWLHIIINQGNGMICKVMTFSYKLFQLLGFFLIYSLHGRWLTWKKTRKSWEMKSENPMTCGPWFPYPSNDSMTRGNITMYVIKLLVWSGPFHKSLSSVK